MKREPFQRELPVAGRALRVSAVPLDRGWQLLVTGGDQSHVGAVSLADPGGPVQTLQSPGHRDAAISAAWAETLARAWGEPVCVAAGVHYDGADRALIARVLAASKALLAACAAQRPDIPNGPPQAKR